MVTTMIMPREVLMEQPVPLRKRLLSQGGGKVITHYVCDGENDKKDFPPWTQGTGH